MHSLGWKVALYAAHSSLNKMNVAITLIVLFLYYLVGWQVSNNPQQIIRAVRIHDMLGTLKTGDIIFTKAKNSLSLLQQYFFGSYVNHCSMIFRANDSSLWVWDTGPSVGAYMTPLYEFVRHNWLGREPPAETPPIGIDISYVNPQKQDRIPELQQSMLFVRRLAKPLDEKKILSFLQRNLGRPYSYRFWKSAVNCITGLQPAFTYDQNGEGCFCSELLMLTYNNAGEVDLQKSPPRSIMPKHFWMNEVHWTNGQTLLTAERLIGQLPPAVQAGTKKGDFIKLWIQGATVTNDIAPALQLDCVDRLVSLANDDIMPDQ